MNGSDIKTDIKKSVHTNKLHYNGNNIAYISKKKKKKASQLSMVTLKSRLKELTRSQMTSHKFIV